MSLHKPIRLTYELLSDEEIDQFSIHSKKEIQFVLKSLARQGGQVALYYGNRETLVLSTILDVEPYGLWLDASQNKKQNELIARSKQFYFVGIHQSVKVQFETEIVENDEYDGLDSFFIPLPRTLLRIQRREHFRLGTPAANPLKCSIPIENGQPGEQRSYPIYDISSGGLALSCDADDSALQEGKIYTDCSISLPDGMIYITLAVRNIFSFKKPNGDIAVRVGCQFIDLDGQVEIQLQRFITQLQHSSLMS